METKYKSSSFMTYLQYVISPIILGICLYGFYFYFSTANFAESLPAYYLPLMLWITIALIINIIKLRYIEVNENNIIIKTLSGEKVLNYKDIEWINQNFLGSNWYIITIKYHNNENSESEIIYMLPEMNTSKENTFNIFRIIVAAYGSLITQELNVTKYIREQIIKANPAYRVEDEPSRWYLVKWMFFSIIPFLLVSILLV